MTREMSVNDGDGSGINKDTKTYSHSSMIVYTQVCVFLIFYLIDNFNIPYFFISGVEGDGRG